MFILLRLARRDLDVPVADDGQANGTLLYRKSRRITEDLAPAVSILTSGSRLLATISPVVDDTHAARWLRWSKFNDMSSPISRVGYANERRGKENKIEK